MLKRSLGFLCLLLAGALLQAAAAASYKGRADAALAQDATGCAFSPRGTYFLVVSPGRLQVYNTRTALRVFDKPIPYNRGFTAAISEDEDRLGILQLGANPKGAVYVFSTGKFLVEVGAQSEGIAPSPHALGALDFNPDGTSLLLLCDHDCSFMGGVRTVGALHGLSVANDLHSSQYRPLSDFGILSMVWNSNRAKSRERRFRRMFNHGAQWLATLSDGTELQEIQILGEKDQKLATFSPREADWETLRLLPGGRQASYAWGDGGRVVDLGSKAPLHALETGGSLQDFAWEPGQGIFGFVMPNGQAHWASGASGRPWQEALLDETIQAARSLDPARTARLRTLVADRKEQGSPISVPADLTAAIAEGHRALGTLQGHLEAFWWTQSKEDIQKAMRLASTDAEKGAAEQGLVGTFKDARRLFDIRIVEKNFGGDLREGLGLFVMNSDTQGIAKSAATFEAALRPDAVLPIRYGSYSLKVKVTLTLDYEIKVNLLLFGTQTQRAKERSSRTIEFALGPDNPRDRVMVPFGELLQSAGAAVLGYSLMSMRLVEPPTIQWEVASVLPI